MGLSSEDFFRNLYSSNQFLLRSGYLIFDFYEKRLHFFMWVLSILWFYGMSFFLFFFFLGSLVFWIEILRWIQVLGYGRNRNVILGAPQADPDCVLGNILAAHFLCSSDPSKAPGFLDAAKSHLVNFLFILFYLIYISFSWKAWFLFF